MKYVCLVYLVEKDMDALSEARDLNDAIQVAAKIPMGRRGSIEVRPIKELKR
jgi:hypothetical protein